MLTNREASEEEVWEREGGKEGRRGRGREGNVVSYRRVREHIFCGGVR